jgi:hypothetical protein
MFKNIHVTLLATAACLAAGCASNPPLVRNSHVDAATKQRLLAFATEAKNERFDQPAEAQRFFLSQRLPDGVTSLDYSLYANAETAANKLPWYSLTQNKVLGPLSPDQLADLSTWQTLGPGNVGGRTRVLRFHPANPNIMYVAGVAGGLWKSVNAGASWVPLTDLAPNLAIVSMVIDTNNPQRMWVGTGEGVFNGDLVQGNGIFMSTDGGLNWNQLASTNNTDFNYVNDLIQSPNGANVLYAATRTGTLRSLDSGTSWTKVIDTSASGANLIGGCFSLVTIANVGPADTVLSACGSFGKDTTFTVDKNGIVYRNTDAGGVGTWTNVLSPTNMGRTSLAVAPSNQQIMYALVAGGEQTGASAAVFDGLLGVWRSIDGGATWSPKVQNSSTNANNNLLLSNPIEAWLTECGFAGPGADFFLNQGWYDNVIKVDPVNPDRVWVGGIDLWRSDDQGANWNVASYWWFPTPEEDPIFGPHYAHADNHGIFFHPGYDGSTNKQMIVTSDGGIFKTLDATLAVGTDASNSTNNSICANNDLTLPAITWTNLNNGYAVTQFYDGTVYPDGATYFGGTQDNGTNRGNDASGANAWEKIFGGDGGYVAVDPTNTQVLYAETTGISIRKSIDGGTTFNSATSGISADGGLFITPFAIDQNNSSRLWTGGTKLWRTDTAAASWVQAASDVLTGGREFSAFAIANSYPNLLSAATNSGRVYVTQTATTNTSATALPTFTVPRGGYVAWLAFDPTQTFSNLGARTLIAVYTTFGGFHVFKSVNSGATWASIDGTTGAALPDIPVDSVAIDPTTSGAQRIFVGTDIGVFVTNDGGLTWTRENTGFANTRVSNLVIQHDQASTTMVLYAFTHGRSAYKTTFEPGDYIFANGGD